MNTVIKSISVVKDTIPPYIIIYKKRRIDNQQNDNLDLKTIVDISDTGYSNNKIGLSFLQHFIKHTQSSFTSQYKMLLFDSVDLYEIEEFKKLAFSYNIILLCYPPYLIHLMQLLDVGCFQLYIHQHDRAVYKAIRNFEMSYDTSSFLQDLPKFRNKTFTLKTIVSIQQKAGMWLPKAQVVLQKMKKYSNP